MMIHRTVLFVLLFVLFGGILSAEEHPGDHPGEEWVEKDQVKQTIKDYIEGDARLKGGYFLLWDDKERRTLRLKFSKFHKKVRYIKDEGAYFMCTDFISLDDRRLIDVDFWLKPAEDGTLRITTIKIHKVNNVPRFIYEKDRIRPVEIDKKPPKRGLQE